MSKRIQKANQLIKKTLSQLIAEEISLKEGVFLTISRVDTSQDLRYTQVFVSIFPEKETNYVLKSLEKELYSIQGKLNKKLPIKNLPRIKFSIDTTEADAQELEKILQNLN